MSSFDLGVPGTRLVATHGLAVSFSPLEDIPSEVWEHVLAYLDWNDIIRFRKTSRRFRDISFNRGVWQDCFLHNLAQGRFPRPFFLPKPMHYCSATELESVVIRWQRSWPDPVPFELSYRTILLGVLEGRTIEEKHYLPGGRWLMILCNDGSAWSLDLADSDNEVVPRPLTPSPYEYGSHAHQAKMWVVTGFDFISHTREHPGCYHLHSFTFATATIRWDSDPGYQPGESVHINVWRVQTVSDALPLKDAHCGWVADALIATDHLSSFREMRFLNDRPVDKSKSRRSTMSIFGQYVAYPLFQHNLDWPCVAIVDWEKANRTIDWHTLLRWCIPKCYVTTIQLLPNLQILVGSADVSRNVRLYCWKRDCPDPSTTRLDVAKTQRVVPAWDSMDRFATSAGSWVDIGCRYLVGTGVRCLISIRNHRAWLQVTPKAASQPALEDSPIVEILDSSDATRRNILGALLRHPPGSGFLRSLDRDILQSAQPCVSEWFPDVNNPEWQNLRVKAIECGDEVKRGLGIEEQYDVEAQFDEYSSKVLFHDEEDMTRVCVAQVLPL